jgi:hypothetical protein
MFTENFIIKLYIESVNVMAASSWQWPESWSDSRKIMFLNEALSYGEKNELYEQCSIIRDVKEKITNN